VEVRRRVWLKRLLGIRGKVGVVGLFVVDRGGGREEERRSWVEIGRDAAAFFSDLNFGFLLMHYIKNMKKKKTPLLSLTFLFLHYSCRWVFDVLIDFGFGSGFGCVFELRN
jgi:hypothetical protein